MSGLFITADMVGYSFVAASFNCTITFSFFAGWVSDSDELLTSCAGATLGVGFWLEAFAPTLVFDVLVEAWNTKRRERLTFPLAGGSMIDCVGSLTNVCLLLC